MKREEEGASMPSPFRLTRVHIRNFRCIRDLTLGLDETTVLIGENNSGKTAVLKAIELCLDRLRGPRSRVFDVYDYHLRDVNTEPENAEPIKVELRFDQTTPAALTAELQEDLVDVLARGTDGRRVIWLRVTAGYDGQECDFRTQAEFLDATGQPKGPALPRDLANLRRHLPVHFLSARRDADRQFTVRGPFWREFLSAAELDLPDREDIESRLTALSEQLVQAHAPLREVAGKLGRMTDVVPTGSDEAVRVDAIPIRAAAVLEQARVNVAARGGARIPLSRQGEGMQSLAVLSLFRAYLERQFDTGEGCEAPLTIVEEPEAHLHPGAVRSVMGILTDIRGQLLLSTHSGDAIRNVDPRSVRRLVHRRGRVRCYRGRFDAMDVKAHDTFRRKVRYGVGDLLFARAWLTYEGETEAIVFRAVAEAIGVDLDQCGIALIQCSDISPGRLFGIANDFGIPWFLVCDGDDGRKKYEPAARQNLAGAQPKDRIHVLDSTIEALLARRGFHDVYSGQGTKTEKARKVAELLISGQKEVPLRLKKVVLRARGLARE